MGSCLSVSQAKVESASDHSLPEISGCLIERTGSNFSTDSPKFLERAESAGTDFKNQQTLTPLIRFTLKQLTRGSKNFSKGNLLGEGAFGKVYNGMLQMPDGKEIFCAIKRLNPDSMQGQDEWMAEIIVLGSVSHPHLIKLLGYCSEREEGLLVYELCPLGSLDKHLYLKESSKSGIVLTWKHRLRIAYQIGQALLYLHKKKIIHRDLKPANVLLDENLDVKITDFGLSKITNSQQSHVTTRILGTMGYLDPKYVETGQLSRLSDVYSYGVLLLELLTGRRAVESDQPDSKPLTLWAHEFFNQLNPNILEFLDPRIVEEVKLESSEKAATYLGITARHCTSWNIILRPSMAEVVDILRDLVIEQQKKSMERLV